MEQVVTNVEKQTRNRKSATVLAEEHQVFLTLVRAGTPQLEVMGKLKLSLTQFKAHLLEALTKKEVSEFVPAYEVVKASSLPTAICSMVGATEETLLKVESDNGGIRISILS